MKRNPRGAVIRCSAPARGSSRSRPSSRAPRGSKPRSRLLDPRVLSSRRISWARKSRRFPTGVGRLRDQAAELIEVAAQPLELLRDVRPVRGQGRLLLEPAGIEGDVGEERPHPFLDRRRRAGGRSRRAVPREARPSRAETRSADRGRATIAAPSASRMATRARRRLAGEGLDRGNLVGTEGILGALDRDHLGHGEDVARRRGVPRSGTSARAPTAGRGAPRAGPRRRGRRRPRA